MTKEQANQLLRSADFTFAKTMHQLPHWYILEKKYGSDFKALADFINENGKKEKFYSREFTYYYLDEYKYWVMSISDGTGIINRASA